MKGENAMAKFTTLATVRAEQSTPKPKRHLPLWFWPAIICAAYILYAVIKG
jgi:hypothetical protein